MRHGPGVPGIAWNAWRAERGGTDAVLRRQRARLARLVRDARHASPYYRELYRGLPADVDQWLLPPVTKPELMARFDEWVTDPGVTLGSVRRDFLADQRRVGDLHLGRYRVFTSSGSSGEPAVLLHDHASWTVAETVVGLRARRTVLRPDVVVPLVRRGLRTAVVVATGGHTAAVSSAEALRRRSPRQARRIRVLSVLRPLPDLVAELEAIRPALLVGYPSVVRLLAGEQRTGRLRISPALAAVGGEALTADARHEITEAFGCTVLDEYAAAEAPGLAVQCSRQELHVNADQYLFEPVDARHRPVPAGERSATVLVTNLANRVQPLIRYDLGDRVVVRPDPCPCGSPLPAVRVEGRSGDVLRFRSPDGREVSVPPRALAAVLRQTPGVRRFQAVRTSPAELTVHLEPESGADPEQVRAAVDGRLTAFLGARGLRTVVVRHSPDRPAPDPRSGKYREVWSR